MSSPSPSADARLPRQIPYIIGNEACERFSFYGMRNILVPFLVTSVMLAYAPVAERQGIAKEIFHTFVIGVYFFPLLGGWLADRFFGKYRTIFWLSAIYVLGHAFLAIFETQKFGFYAGLFLIALGSGGIKPLVSAFVGDQFTQANKHKAKVVYDAFYWTINFGSFFASLLIPALLKHYGPAVAFGVPGILMALALLIFWLGRDKYVMMPPTPRDPDSFLNVSRTALAAAAPGRLVAFAGFALALAMFALWAYGLATGEHLLGFELGFVTAFCLALVALLTAGGIGTSMQLELARGKHPDAAVDGVRAVLRILIVFALVTPFWSLFDQKASTWVLQGELMTKPEWFQSAQMQALNPALVMLIIPFNNLVLYPLLRRMGMEPTPLKRMGYGIAFSALAWIVAGMLQLRIDDGTPTTIVWQVLPYALLTFGEVLVSATGLEFAYSQAPPSMKGSIMSFWMLSVTIGNLWVLLTNSALGHAGVKAQIAASGIGETAFLMFFFAAFALLAAGIFALYARRYPMQDFYRGSEG